MAWLEGWDKRVKLTIDQGDISAALANFPVLLYLSTDSGRGSDDISFIFDELESAANKLKIAVTTSDGMTQCYVEIDKWDHGNEKAWLWVKVPAVAYNADTDLYLYYDVNHAENTAYVGELTDAVVHNVWDGNFKFVSHLQDSPDTSHVLDSTVNANDGTKKGANEPQLAVGQIADGQSFDGTDDYIEVPGNTGLSLITNQLTISGWVKSTWGADCGFLTKRRGDNKGFFVFVTSTGYFSFAISTGTPWSELYTAGPLASGAWAYFTGVYDGSELRTYINGQWSSTLTEVSGNIDLSTVAMRISYLDVLDQYFPGIIDEVRISNAARNAAWIAASYESGRDDLLDWGAEEPSVTGTVAFEVETVVLAGTGTFTFQWHGTAAFEVEPVALASTGTAEPPIIHAFAGMEITIESPYGTKLGSGPITTALSWRNSPSLDGAGAFSFEMLLTDPRASLIAKKRYARCYGLFGGSWQELGKAGIIDRIETVVESDQGPRFVVSGKDLMRELTFRTVGDLELVEAEAAYSTPGWVNFQAGDLLPDYGWNNKDLPKAFDDNVGTKEEVRLYFHTGFPTQTSYVYIGYPYRTAGIRYNLDAKNTEDANSLVQFFNGSAWVGVANFVDGTKVGAVTLAQDGDMTFTKPTTQEKTTHEGVEAYWLRHSVTNNDYRWMDVEIIEVDVLAEGPTTEGLADIMAFAPAGWSIDTVNGYATTGEGAYTRFTGQNVLEALVILAQLTGEHFRLGVGRKVVWIRDDPVDNPVQCGYRALSAYGGSVGDNLLVCAIRSMVKVEDSFEECSRVYPHGAGTYPNRIDLEHATADVPDGYAYSTVDNYLKHTATDDALRIDKDVVFPEAGFLTAVSNELTANQLLARTVEYLKRHKGAHESYEIVVVGLAGLVNPGEVIPVQYWEYVEGVLVLDVDKTLIILEPTIEVTSEGLFTVALVVSTTDMWPRNDARKLVRFWQITTRGLAG